MTFLRHPVNNLISIYFFWKSFGTARNPVHAQFLSERPSVLDFARYPAFSNLMSETYFGGFDMRRFNFIGFYENRDSDMSRLAADTDLPLVANVHENLTPKSVERCELEANNSVQRRLADLLSDDLKFYEQMRNRTDQW
jgi:hypothetical protein